MRGRYINLKESEERRSQIQKQLIKLEKHRYYERFEAIKGDAEEASKRNLKAGELGIWKSWIKLLSEESINDKHYEFLHIIEDDCILTKGLFEVVRRLSHISSKHDILVTDMYVNPSIYNYLAKPTAINKNKKSVEILSNLYTGCLASVIIPRGKIKKIGNLLTIEYNKAKKLVPLDNFLVRLREQNQIYTGVTIPFMTSIRPDSITKSTIQTREMEEKAITKTQEICYLLRKKLSILPEEAYCNDIIRATAELFNIIAKAEKGESEIITDMAINFLEQENLLTYKLRANLEGEPLNPQISQP